MPPLAPERLKAFYVQMTRIRRAEEAIVARYPEQEIRCPTHLSIGQEAVAVGICQALNLEPEYIRRGLRRWRDQQLTLGEESGKVVRFPLIRPATPKAA